MRYKLLLLDLDDTLVPNLGMPPREFTASPRLIKTIKKAQTHLAVSLCTGRDKETVIKVVGKLRLTSPQIIGGGSKIIDAQGNDLWAQYLSENSAMKVLAILKKTKTSFSVVLESTEILDAIPENNLDKISAVLWYDLTQKEMENLNNQLSLCSDITLSINKDRTGNTVYVTHRQGTKDYAIRQLMAILGVKKEEIIGVGDGNNDKPLLLMCGLKVAMGNAVKELKEIADYVAPSVYNDGVAEMIERFVLTKTRLEA